jgi:hypothetical protein
VSYLTIFNNELLWIILIFFISSYTLYQYKKKNSTNDFVRDFSNAVFFSLGSLAVVFLGYHFFPSEDSLFSKLVSGEVIVGVTVAFPILFTWYRRDKKEKADSKALQEEEKKIQKERYNYQQYTEIKNDYLTWFKSFYEENMNLSLALVNLEQIVERVKVFDEISDSKDMHPIDFTSLFVAIQEKFRESCITVSDQSDINNIYESWRLINNDIIAEMDESQRRKYVVKDVYAIDFITNSDMLEYYDRAYSFNGCRFESDEFLKFIQNDAQSKFNNIFLDRKITSEEHKTISGSGELNSYFYIDDLGNTCLFDRDQEKQDSDNHTNSTSQTDDNDREKEKQDSVNPKNSSEEVPCSVSNDLTQISESPSQERPSNRDLIYENRDLADYGPINDLIESGKSITVSINNDNSSIKQKIFDELKLSIPMLNEIKNNTYFISRSKNFVPDMKDSEQKKWEWHSWNVLTKMKTEDKKIKFYIFAVQTSDRAFECIVINKENLGELLKHKSMTKDSRYFFYFAKEK